ncbi:killer cell lectin receptor subfamily F member 1, partial [Biomphalaria glabrata]
TSVTQISRFYKAESSLPIGLNIVSTVQTESVIDCAIYCISLNLICFLFNEEQGACDVGHISVSNVTTYSTKEIYILCNTYDGFRLYIKGSVIACVWLSSSVSNYTIARNNCNAMSTHLYTIKTLEKMQILQENYVSNGKIWIGLNDILEEGVYRWEDDDSICDDSCKAMIYAQNEPNNYGNSEDCNVFNANTSRVNDFPCNDIGFYLCEKAF